MGKITEASSLVACPFQQNEIPRVPRGSLGVLDEYRRPPVCEPERQPPIVCLAVVAKIAVEATAPLPLCRIHKIESHVFYEHVAYRIKVACIEAFDIEF